MVLPDLVWSSMTHRETAAELILSGWIPCGVGDWAIGLRSPDGRWVARVCPFDPAYAEVHNNRGIALDHLKRYEEALASYDRALAARPDFVGVIYPGPTPVTREPATKIPRNVPPSFIASAGSGDKVHALWETD